MNTYKLIDTIQNEKIVLLTNADVVTLTNRVQALIDYTVKYFAQFKKIEDNVAEVEAILDKITEASKQYLLFDTEVTDKLEWFCIQYTELVDALKRIDKSHVSSEIIQGLYRFMPSQHSKEGMLLSCLLPFRIGNIIAFYENNDVIRNMNNIQYVWTPAKLLKQIITSGANQTANLAILEDLTQYQIEEPLNSEFKLMTRIAQAMVHKAEVINNMLNNETSIMYKGDQKGIMDLLKSDIIFGEDISTENSIETFERFATIF